MADRSASGFDKIIGAKIRYRRTEIGLSQAELAERLGLSYQQVQKYEVGTNRIGAGRLFEISLLLEVPPSFFFEGLPRSSRSASAAKESSALFQFMSDPEGIRLMRAISTIQSDRVKRRLLALLQELGDGW